jgi:hypothetical protein
VWTCERLALRSNNLTPPTLLSGYQRQLVCKSADGGNEQYGYFHSSVLGITAKGLDRIEQRGACVRPWNSLYGEFLMAIGGSVSMELRLRPRSAAQVLIMARLCPLLARVPEITVVVRLCATPSR